jgi:siroheme synthase
VIERATTERQGVVTGALRDLPDAAAAAGVKPPALIVVGEVVKLRASLDSYSTQAARSALPFDAAA